MPALLFVVALLLLPFGYCSFCTFMLLRLCAAHERAKASNGEERPHAAQK